MKKHLLYLLLLLLQSASGSAINSHELPIRDPFSLPILSHCDIDQHPSAALLKKWQLIGTIGQKDHWQSWIITDKQQWLAVKKGDQPPNLDLTVSLISQHFMEFQAKIADSADCDEFAVVKHQAIQLRFLE